MDAQTHLIRAQDACCADLVGVDAYVGVTFVHPDAGDGTSHELDVYWRDPPPGRQHVELAEFDPLTLTSPVTCPCGWSDVSTGGDPPTSNRRTGSR